MMKSFFKRWIALIAIPSLVGISPGKWSAAIAYNHQHGMVQTTPRTLDLPGNLLSPKPPIELAQFAPPEIAEQAKKVTVIINGQNPGSGVIIAKENNTYYVLTAKHVVATQDEYEIVTIDGQEHILDYGTVKKLPEIDLALVEFTSDRNYAVAKIGDSDAATEGQGIYISGWPHPGQAITDRIFQITTGFISGRAFGVAEDGYELVYTNITRSGMSGGAVFDAEGRLIGIHGRAEGQAIYDPDSGSTIEIKSGFNLGIPIKVFISQTAQADLPANPSFSYPLSSWGSEFLRSNQLDQASASFAKALAIAPQSFFALFGMSQTHYQQGQMSEALRLVQSALEIQPEDREIKSSVQWEDTQIDVTVKLAEALTIYQMGDREKGLALASAVFAKGEYPLESLFSDWPLDMTSETNPSYDFTGINDFLIAIVKEYIWSERMRADAKELLTYLIPQTSRSFAEKVFSENLLQIELDRSGTILVTSADDHTIVLWDIASGNKLRSITEPSEYLNNVVLSDDAEVLAVANENGIKVWDVASGNQLSQISENFGWMEKLGMSPDKSLLVGANNSDYTIQIWPMGSGEQVNQLSGYSEDVESIAFDPDNQILATGHEQGSIKLWDWRSGQERMTLNGHSEEVNNLAWSANGEILVSSSWDDTVKVWAIDSGTELHSFPGWIGSPIALSPDGNILAIGNINAGIQLWNLRTGELMRTLRLYDPLVLKEMSFNENGSELVSVYWSIEDSDPDWIKIWPVQL